MWVNVGRSSPSHIAALQLAYDEGLDIICVQEPYTCGDTRTSTHPGYLHHPPIDAWDSRDRQIFEQQRPRVMTYTRKGVGLHIVPRASLHDRDMMWIEINGLSVLNIYRQPQDPRILHYVTNLTPPSRCIVGGDFNAKHDTFEPGVVTSQGGSELARWAAASSMDYIGEPGRPTHRAGHVIDLTFTNIPFARTTVQDALHCGSDHNTLVTEIPGRGVETLEQYHFKIPEHKLPTFASLVELGMHQVPAAHSITNTAQLDACVEAITRVFQEAVQAAGKPNKETGRSAPWWTTECKAAYRTHLRSLTANQGSQGHGPTQETRDFLTTVRNAKRDYWRHTIDSVNSDKDLFRIVGWHKLEPRRQEQPLVINGQAIIDPDQKAEALRQAILCRFTSEDDLPDAPSTQDETVDIMPWRTYLSAEEVERSTIGVSSTSPGPDRITVRLLKACWPHVKRTVTGIYRKCLTLCHFPASWKLAEVAMAPKVGKKDRSSTRSWRPIALLSCLGKGLERILARRLAWTAMRHDVLSPQHVGALPKRSALDLAASFTHDVEKAFALGQQVTMVTMDVMGAFDALLKNRLLHRMRQQGWATGALQIVDSFLSNRMVRVRLGKATTPEYSVQCGTPQGSPLSPVLYSLYLAELLRRDTTYRFGYADDICLYRAAHSLDESNRLVAEDIRSVQQWGEENHVAFAPDKLEMIHLTRSRASDCPPIRVNDNMEIRPIQQTENEQPALRWLGVFFDRRLTFKRHVKIRAAKARQVARHIRSLAKTTCGPLADSLRKAVITCVIPRLLYGAEVWYGGRTKPSKGGPKEVSTRLGGHVDIVNSTIAMAARGVLPAYRTTPTATLFRDSGLPAGPVALEEARLRFAVRLQTADPTHPLTHRAGLRLIRRGRGAGTQQQPRTVVQRVGALLPPVPRPILTEPHYSLGCRTDPTQGIKKKQAAEDFKKWYKTLPRKDITIFSDGSEQWVEGSKHVTYGYVIYQGGKRIGSGRGSLNTRSHVFDAEIVGAARGLTHALRTPANQNQRVWLCIDSTSVIWCLRGNASLSSQWAFLRCQENMSHTDVRIRWAPGHMRIPGNEEADRLANEEAHDPRRPYGPAAEPTVTGLRSDARSSLRMAEIKWWQKQRTTLSVWYNQWKLDYHTTPQKELSLSRRTLGKLLATRTRHGDYAWYHQKFKHEDASLNCSHCSRLKTPEHIVFCRKTKHQFGRWPQRPAWPPTNKKEGLDYLKTLLASPQDFADFLEVTNY